jgi:hypothetical protein
MATRSITIIVAGLLIHGSAGGHDGIEKLDVEAGTVTVKRSSVNGSWMIFRSATGINSRGTGGACLLQKATDRGGPAQCETGAPIPGWDMDEWFAYKAPDGSCWVKPGGACNRSPDYAPNGPRRWEIGTYTSNLEPLSSPVRYEPTHWRVVACINGFDPATGLDNKHCGGVPEGETPNFRESWGPVRTKP